MNFDKLRLVADRAGSGEKEEAPHFTCFSCKKYKY